MIITTFFLLFVVFWLFKRREYALVFLVLFTTNGFKIKFFGSQLTWDYNFLWFFENIFLIYGLFSNSFKKRLKDDRMLRFICVSYLFFLVHFFLSVLLGAEEFGWAFTVLRQVTGPILLYVPLSSMSSWESKKAYTYLFVIVSVVCAFYLLQFLGLSIFLSNEGDSTGVVRSGYVRCIEFFVITSLFFYKRKYMSAIFWAPVIGGAARGSVTAILMSLLIVFKKKFLKLKYMVLFFVVLIPCMVVYVYVVADNYRRYNISFVQEIQNGLNLSFISNPKNYLVNSNIRMDGGGTFGFRTAMLAERVQYIVKNPKYLLFGCGMIAEQSPKNNFHFFLGTARDRYGGINQIWSVDILWVSFVLRFGFCGVLFWMIFFYLFYKRFSGLGTVAMAGRAFVLYLFIHSFGTMGPFNTANMTLLVLLSAGLQTNNSREEKNESFHSDCQLQHKKNDFRVSG